MLIHHIAVVSELAGFRLSELSRVAAALQKQVTRDLSPIWGVRATVDAFRRLEDVPIGYWPILVTDRELGDEAGVHMDASGEPYALVEAGSGWSLAASHECLEMLVDPFGHRLVAAPSPIASQGRVQMLVEVCDPCQAARYAYTVNDVLVSDFYTPDYFEPTANASTRYSFTGSIRGPREVLPGGYLTWLDPVARAWWQRTIDADGAKDRPLGALEEGMRSAREWVNRRTPNHRAAMSLTSAEQAHATGHKRMLGARASASRAAAIRSDIARRGIGIKAEPVNDGTGPASAPTVPRTGEQWARAIDDAIRVVSADPTLPDAPKVLDALNAAAKAARALPPSGISPMRGELEPFFHMVQSAMAAPPMRASHLTGKDVPGLAQYEHLNPGWIATVWNRLVRSKVPFPVCPKATPPRVELVYPMSDGAVIAFASDWGTGNESSKRIARIMNAIRPTHTIHLGDVYYSGTEWEEQHNFVELWPTGSVASFALNSNHEMYSGGHGYFGIAMMNEKFETQGPYSYFALTNDQWLLVGLDSAYEATDFYQVGALNAPQTEWLARLVASPSARASDGTPKRIIVMTHHQPHELDGTRQPLWDHVTRALGRAPDYWYFGHIHGGAAFQPMAPDGRMRTRLVGHGGVPYIADPKTPIMEWSETERANDPAIPERCRNGFGVLRFDGAQMREELRDEYGAVRWPPPA